MKESDKIKFLAEFGERVRRIRRERDMTLEKMTAVFNHQKTLILLKV